MGATWGLPGGTYLPVHSVVFCQLREKKCNQFHEENLAKIRVIDMFVRKQMEWDIISYSPLLCCA